jgi:hypothetical protein
MLHTMRLLRPLRMPRLLVALAICASTACAHGPGLSAERVERAYLEARLPSAACRSNDPVCCEDRVRAARAADDAGYTARSASLWQEVALGCPDRRPEGAAAALSTKRPAPAADAPPPAAPPGLRVLNVSYRARLSPAVRLYWVSAEVGPRLMPTADTAPSDTHPVRVEVQAIRFDGGRPGPLVRIERRFDVPFNPEAVITLEIAELPGSGAAAPSLEVLPQVQPIPAPRRRPDAPRAPPRGPPPVLEKARPRTLDPPRSPIEFGAEPGGARPWVRLCLDQDGQLETLRFLEAAHPRLTASIIDMFRDSRYEPYRVNDRPVPSCEVTRPSSSSPR